MRLAKSFAVFSFFFGGQSELAILFRFFWQFFSGFHFARFDCVWQPIRAKTGAPKWSHTTGCG